MGTGTVRHARAYHEDSLLGVHQRDALVGVAMLDLACQLAPRVAAASNHDAFRLPDLFRAIKVELISLLTKGR
jgi:hypothetical protein